MTSHTARSQTSDILLREVTVDDLPIFFEHQKDPDANYMAAFTSKNPADREAFMEHWNKILRAEDITRGFSVRTILVDGQVAGHVLTYVDEELGSPEVSYWLGKTYWGRGITTRALSLFLEQVFTTRPVYARVAKDNIGSRRVLEKCGFAICGANKGYANARGEEIEEFILKLDGKGESAHTA